MKIHRKAIQHLRGVKSKEKLNKERKIRQNTVKDKKKHCTINAMMKKRKEKKERRENEKENGMLEEK